MVNGDRVGHCFKSMNCDVIELMEPVSRDQLSVFRMLSGV
jgi:hypothetical protein